ncbi:PREDICTED: uncharacterized protein LOC104816193 [Tarenaya hassleriana]|uniref:uncharacterized protein LOC104816193 n=1 Tax=Tarenaya hassleriana TaxID=28532 RepID=UPI00053C850C|nr:PREDICTED: uncharacterized protein LOC104816193 [Tarenaya hassleriana]
MSQPDSFSSPSSPPVIREEGGFQRFDHGRDHGFDRDRPPWNRDRRHDSFAHRHGSVATSDNAGDSTTDDPWSCVVVVVTFYVFVSMTLIMGLYGTTTVWLGPNSSFLVQPTSVFVQSVIVEQLDKRPGMLLYGLDKTPELDVLINWSEVHYLAVPYDSYKYWIQYLNKGSQIKVSYNVESPGSSLYLVIAEGTEGLSEWVQDPTRPDKTLSWNLIYGSGVIQQDITKSSSYYIAVGNVYLNEVKATLDFHLDAVLYNTTEAYYNCNFPNAKCSFNVPFFGANAAVLTSPGPQQNISKNEFCVKVSYEPRWLAYIVCIGGVTALLVVLYSIFKKPQSNTEAEATAQNGETAPLVPGKDDDVSSWCSSYSSIMTSTEEIEGHEGENNSGTRYLCAICFDAPRDCFFLSCGHSVACFQCGTRIAEASGNCPVCRKKIRKVKKIFNA